MWTRNNDASSYSGDYLNIYTIDTSCYLKSICCHLCYSSRIHFGSISQCRTNQCGLPCKYSGTSLCNVSTTRDDTLALHVTYLKNISRYRNTFLKRFHCTVLILTYTQPYFAICAGTNTWMSKLISLDIDMFRQQFRNEYLNVLFWASIPLFVLSYNCLPTRNAWTHICK